MWCFSMDSLLQYLEEAGLVVQIELVDFSGMYGVLGLGGICVSNFLQFSWLRHFSINRKPRNELI